MKRDGHIQMMTKHSSMNELYANIITDLKYDGRLVESYQNGSRIGELLELLNYQVTLTDPTKLYITHPKRKWKENYALAEFLFYVGANRKVGSMPHKATIWGIISDEWDEVESNYGTYIFNSNWLRTVEELMVNPGSRRAVIPILNEGHFHKNDKDYPCTGYIQFQIRESKLYLTWNMRSCDAIFGLCNDMFCASMIQQMMLNELCLDSAQLAHCGGERLRVTLGNLTFNLGSLHIYKRHWGLVFEDVSEWRKYSSKSFKLKPNCIPDREFKRRFGVYPEDKVKDIDAKITDFYSTHIAGGDFCT